MRLILPVLTIAFLAACLNPSESQAGWKVRGWYSGSRAIKCEMKNVALPQANGKIAIQKIRVCR